MDNKKITQEQKEDLKFPYIINCLVEASDKQVGAVFASYGDNIIIPKLDGYAIIPIEKYYALIKAQKDD